MPTHLLEDGMDIITLKDLGHQNLETTLEYLQQNQESTFSPLDTLLRNAAQVADVLRKLGKE
jgi:hypothetical protein